jgi:hypothetical protein
MEQQDTPHDALVDLLQLLPLTDRVRLSGVSTAWLRAAAETFKDVEAKVDNKKAPVGPAALLAVCWCPCTARPISSSTPRWQSACLHDMPWSQNGMMPLQDTIQGRACLTACMQAFRSWLKRHGGQVEVLSVGSCEPVSALTIQHTVSTCCAEAHASLPD